MKKIVLLLFILILTGCKNKEEFEELNVYEAKEVCDYTSYEEIDGDVYNSKSIVYLNYDEEKFVTSAVYQSISDLTSVTSYTYETYDYIKRLYSTTEGVSVDYYKTKDSLVLEIKYDYMKIDLNEFRNTLGALLDQGSVLGSSDKLPIELDVFKNIELKDYDCK